MQENDLKKLASTIACEFKQFFNDRIKGSTIFNIVDENLHHSFCIRFCIYDYFPIVFGYNNKRISCSIVYGKFGKVYTIPIKTTVKWWNEQDFDLFLKDVEKDIELRIPDKFLKSRGWLK